MTRWPEPMVPEGCPSELHLDQLVVGELADAAASTAREHVAGCDSCRARVDEIERDRRQFLDREAVTPLVRRRPRPRWVATAIGAAAAAAIAVVILTRPGGDDGRTRIKGTGDRMAVFVAHQGAIRRAGPGEPVVAGDALQMTVTLGQARHVALIGVDERGAASVYFPDGDRAEALGPGEEIGLPTSVVLDAAPGREDFIAVFCTEALPVARIRAMLAVDRTAVPVGCSADRLHVVKPGGR